MSIQLLDPGASSSSTFQWPFNMQNCGGFPMLHAHYSSSLGARCLQEMVNGGMALDEYGLSSLAMRSTVLLRFLMC